MNLRDRIKKKKSQRKKHLQLLAARAKKLGGKMVETGRDDGVAGPAHGSASHYKLASAIAVSPTVIADEPASDQQWLLFQITQLNALISELICPNCYNSKLQLAIEKVHQGFCSSVMLECVSLECKETYRRSVYTSSRLRDRTNFAFEINTRMVLLAHELGLGYKALQKIGKVLGVPTLNLNAYQKQDRKVTVAEVQRGLESLNNAAERVRSAYADVDPDVADLLDKNKESVIDIQVSFDGTWQKRGFTSNYGVGVCIDIITGLVIDYEVLSLYCHTCVLKERQRVANEITEVEFKNWREAHSESCARNFQGSSKAMEQEAAKRMWARSLSRHQLRYTEMLSDGDSTAYNAVVSLAPYAGIQISKLECINHAHKRMGTALRKLSSEKHLGGKGVGKLTAQKCKSLQNFYRGAVLENQGNIEGMKTAIWAGLLHSMSTDDTPHHDRCSLSWCWYLQALAKGEEAPSHQKHTGQTFLSKEVGKQLLPVYHRMTGDSLLRRMQHGKTQNANECLNSVIWSRCPKTVFVGKGRVEAAVGMAVATFNEGAIAITAVMDKLWLESTIVTLESIQAEDELCIVHANAASCERAKKRRKSLDTAKKIKRHQQQLEEGLTYGAGIAD